MIARLQLWLTITLLAWLCAGCERQVDLVALRSSVQGCDTSRTCDTESVKKDAGTPDEQATPDCDAADGCGNQQPQAPQEKPTEPCADAAACTPPANMRQSCETRACASIEQHAAFCEQDGLTVALGDSCPSADANPEFRFAICSQTDLIIKAPLNVVGDVAVDHDVTLSADVMIDGDLRYVGMFHDYDAKPATTRATFQTSPTCNIPNALRVDIPAAVRARAQDNDNDQASDQLALLTRWKGPQSITLPCGRYYLSSMDGDGEMTVNATGNVAIFVEGAVAIAQGLKFHAAPGARVSLIVNNSVHVMGDLTLGELADARHLLLAAEQIHLESGANTVGGVLYAQNRDILLANATLELEGALYAWRAQLEGTTSIKLAREVLSAGESCQP